MTSNGSGFNYIVFTGLFAHPDNTFFPSLLTKQPIPQELWSRHADPNRTHPVGLGIVKGIVAVATRIKGVEWLPNGTWTASFEGMRTPSSIHKIGAPDDPSKWVLYAAGGSYITAVAGLLSALHPQKGDDEVKERWYQFLDIVTQTTGKRAPFTSDDMIKAASNDLVKNAMMALVNSLYFHMKNLNPRCEEYPGTKELPVAATSIDPILWISNLSSAAASAPVSPTVRQLIRVIKRGGTALMVGPTGAGKTYAGKKACEHQGAHLVVVKGRPGLDDRQFYGGLYPTATHYEWIDGPLAEAWRIAWTQPTMLLIDELARLDPFYLAALIGALDRVTGAELKLILKPADLARYSELNAEGKSELTFKDDEQYYMLKLPTGEILVAPRKHLAVVATANMGHDYAQLQQEFDAALLRRFGIQIDVERLDPVIRTEALVGMGVPHRWADLMVQLEDYSCEMTGAEGGLLRRELNLGTLIEWAEEAISLNAEGFPWLDALTEALPYTAAAFCCPRRSDGRIDLPAREVLTDGWADLAKGKKLTVKKPRG